MEQPKYQKPFEQADFRGYFKWTSELSNTLGGNLYHACHKSELFDILEKNRLELRSEWSLNLPEHGLWSALGVWTGLNKFFNGNNYGPFVITFPLSVLNGRHFMVFLRKDNDGRKRYFFVQYEARIPIFRLENKLWHDVDPECCFNSTDKGLFLKDRAIYDVVLTKPLKIRNATIEAVSHPKCISQKCIGSSRTINRKLLTQIASVEFNKWLNDNQDYAFLLKRFPVLDGFEVKLFDPEE